MAGGKKPEGTKRRELVRVRLPSGEESQAIRILGTSATPTIAVPRHTQRAMTEATVALGGDDGRLVPMLAGRPVPLVSFPDDEDEGLWHVGTLDANDKHAQFQGSYEGAGLSVSRHPDDWRGIARLPGHEWRCSLPDNRFLDRWALTPAQERAIEGWAVEAGLLEPVTRWEARWEDAESGDEAAFYCETYEEALAEANGDEDFITEVRVMAVTPRLSSFTATPAGETAGAFDLALTVYAEAETDFDGVWWEDDYDPLALSCPRGVIVPSRLGKWEFTREADVVEEGQ